MATSSSRPPRKRRQPSSIDKLDPSLQKAIGDLRRAGRSVTEIHEHLVQLGAEVSRSAVGRHVKSMAEIGEEMRRSEHAARFLMAEFGEEVDDRLARANMRILQGAVLRLQTERPLDEDGGVVEMDAAEAKSLSLVIQRLVAAEATNTDRAIKVRREFAVTAADVAEKAMKAKGLSADTIMDIRRAVLGAAE